jgi:cyclic pyranopterin phosphate synthase
LDDLTHFSADGRAHMIDVSEKTATHRVAVASGVIRVLPATLTRIRAGTLAKGNVLAVADVAAVMAAKRTPETIPMCHTLPLSSIEVAFAEIGEPDNEGRAGIQATVTVGCIGATGVEMEALCAVSTALLTIYDMCKAIDRGMCIEYVRLEEKRGGKSGVWWRREPA